jgi:DNA repair exonuclease SbcCD ATPase subunit
VKLLAATVRNYRRHRDTTVQFDGPMVLVHGPNESGKSTLAEAMHCALFLKAKGSTNLHKTMQSDHGGTPEVTLRFEAKGRQHNLRKIFGTSGDTVLESEGQATLNGSAAEECLAQLLGVEGSVSGGGIEGKMQKRWAHLWVWQGASSQTPLDSLEESQVQLRSKLQAQSGRSVLSSRTDDAVIDALQVWEHTNFTQAGAPKTGSELKHAIEALAAAEARAGSAQAAMDELEAAAAIFEQAAADIERHRSNHESAQRQLKDIREKLKAVASLKEQLREKTRLRELAGKATAELKAADTEIRGLERDFKIAEEKAAPLKERLTALKAEAKHHQTETDNARKAREAATRLCG